MRGFRVWSGYWKKYATEAELYVDGSADAVFEDDDGVPHHENTDLVVEFKTGLKDKNGEEIYEGDIVTETYPLKYTQPGSPDNIEAIDYWVVKWEEKRAGFAPFCNCDTNGEYLYEVHIPDIVEVEVVGNIHENPELVKEEE